MASAIDQSVAMLESLHDETRSLVMRWAVNTAALQDLIKRTGQPELPFPEVAQIATRWLEQHSKRTGEFATPREAADRASMSMQKLALGRPPELSLPRSQPPLGRLDAFDRKLSLFMQRYGFFVLRMSLGIVFFWFGALKPFRLSPADDLPLTRGDLHPRRGPRINALQGQPYTRLDKREPEVSPQGLPECGDGLPGCGPHLPQAFRRNPADQFVGVA